MIVIDGEAVLSERLHGKSVRAIARQFGRTVAEINEVLDAVSEPITPEYKVRAVSADLERLDAMQAVWFEKCLAGDYNAGLLCLKIAERRASILGLDQPTSKAFDVIELRAAASPAQSGTDKILRALSDLALTNGGPNMPSPS
jgi:hypothetical protein